MKNMHDRDPIRHDAVENQVPAERAPPDFWSRMPRDKWKGEQCVTQPMHAVRTSATKVRARTGLSRAI
jgi:hypothetical protein